MAPAEGMSDHDRTVFAAVESIAGAVMAIVGVLLLLVGGFVSVIALVLVVLGAFGLGHAVAVGLGWYTPPGSSDRP